MDYPSRPVSASAVSRILALADFKRARPGNTWSHGYQVVGMGTLVEVHYMATRGEEALPVLEAMVKAINAKGGYVAWLGKPDWMGVDLLDNSQPSVMVRKTIPDVAPAARELEAHKASLREAESVAAKAKDREANAATIAANLRPAEPQVVTSERPAEAKQVIQELAVEFDEDRHSVAATALPALREALDAHKAEFFTRLAGEDDDAVLHVRHFHGTKVRVAAVYFEEMGGTFYTHHSRESFASVADIVGHLELFLVGE